MIRSYDLASALKILICMLETDDGRSLAPYWTEETEMLKELYRAIPNPIHAVNEQAFFDALLSYYHAYSVVFSKVHLDPEDVDTIQGFLDKLAQKIEGMRHIQQSETTVNPVIIG